MNSEFYKGFGRIVVASDHACAKVYELLREYDSFEFEHYFPDNLVAVIDCDSFRDIYNLHKIVKRTELVYLGKYEFDFEKLVCDIESCGHGAVVLLNRQDELGDFAIPGRPHVVLPNLSFVLI